MNQLNFYEYTEYYNKLEETATAVTQFDGSSCYDPWDPDVHTDRELTILPQLLSQLKKITIYVILNIILMQFFKYLWDLVTFLWDF